MLQKESLRIHDTLSQNSLKLVGSSSDLARCSEPVHSKALHDVVKASCRITKIQVFHEKFNCEDPQIETLSQNSVKIPRFNRDSNWRNSPDRHHTHPTHTQTLSSSLPLTRTHTRAHGPDETHQGQGCQGRILDMISPKAVTAVDPAYLRGTHGGSGWLSLETLWQWDGSVASDTSGKYTAYTMQWTQRKRGRKRRGATSHLP